MNEVLISTPAQLRELVDHIRATGRFGFDTEFVSEDTFEPVLCLVQVATADRLAVIDPLALPDLGPLAAAALPAVEKIVNEEAALGPGRLQQMAKRIVDRIRAQAKPASEPSAGSAELNQLRDQIKRLQHEQEELRRRLDQYEKPTKKTAA